MMSHDEIVNRLSELVDGELTPAEQTAAERHLEQCEACRHEVNFFRSLQREARALPHSVAPTRDLWPEIAARLQPRQQRAPVEAVPAEADGVVSLQRWQAIRRPRRWQWAAAAAAAVTLVALSSATTAYLLRNQAGGLATTEPVRQEMTVARPLTALAAFQPTEAEYLSTVEALEAELAARRDQLSPETVAVVEANLRIIDQAIQEARAALEADPSNVDLPLLVSGVYRKKVELLRSALELQVQT